MVQHCRILSTQGDGGSRTFQLSLDSYSDSYRGTGESWNETIFDMKQHKNQMCCEPFHHDDFNLSAPIIYHIHETEEAHEKISYE